MKGERVEKQMTLGLESQRESIKKYLLAGHSITQAEAAQRFNCYRLSERIREIEAGGVAVHREREQNASGRGYHTRYSIGSIEEGGSLSRIADALGYQS